MLALKITGAIFVILVALIAWAFLSNDYGK